MAQLSENEVDYKIQGFVLDSNEIRYIGPEKAPIGFNETDIPMCNNFQLTGTLNKYKKDKYSYINIDTRYF